MMVFTMLVVFFFAGLFALVWGSYKWLVISKVSMGVGGLNILLSVASWMMVGDAGMGWMGGLIMLIVSYSGYKSLIKKQKARMVKQ